MKPVDRIRIPLGSTWSETEALYLRHAKDRGCKGRQELSIQPKIELAGASDGSMNVYRLVSRLELRAAALRRLETGQTIPSRQG